MNESRHTRMSPVTWMSHVSHFEKKCSWLRTHESFHVCEWVMSHKNESCHVWMSHMGWLRLVGSIKLYVSFAKEPYKRDDIVQKRPIIWSILLIVATPYHVKKSHVTHSPLLIITEHFASHMNQSCHTCGRVTWHKNESYHVKKSHVTHSPLLIITEHFASHINQSWHTCKWVMSHKIGTHVNESCHTKLSHATWKWVMSRILLCS